MLRRYKSAFISPVAVAAVFAVFFAFNGFFPFGKSSVSWCDMTQQVIPLLCDFKDMLSGNDGFFLSLQNAGGMNFFGVFFFFLASPFSFLVVFFEKADIPLLMNIILVLKLCVCAITSAIYFEKRFNNLTTISKITLSLSYALCGYGMMFYQNIIWLDIMYIFPLLMLGIHQLMEKGKPGLFIITLAFTVVVNFYISYMVILFVLLYFGIYFLYCKSKDYTLFFKLGLSVILALAISAVVWIPSFAQYTASGRKGNIIQGLMHCDFFTPMETCVPILLATSLIFAVLIAFLPSLSNQNKSVKMYTLAFVIMCLPIFIEPVNRMWHTGDYMAFPVRYGFITIFLGFVVCAELLDKNEYARGKRVANILIVIFGVLTGVFGIWYTNKHLDTLSRYARTLWGDRESYKGILTLFLVTLFVGIVSVLLAKNKLISKKVLSLVLAIVVLCEGYSSMMIYISPSNDDLDMSAYTDFCELENEIDDSGFYRVNMTQKLIDANMTGAIGFGSLGHYTSLTDQNYMSAIKSLGYSGYWMEIGNWGGNIISDAMMSVKYNINKNATGFYIEENPLSLGLAVPSKKDLPTDFPVTDRATAVGNIFKNIFSLKKSPVTRYEITDLQGCDYTKKDNTHILTRLSEDNFIEYEIFVEGEQTLYFDCFNGGSNNLEEPINNAFSIYVDSYARYYPSQNENGMLELGTFKNKKVTIWLQLNKDVSCYSFGIFGFDVDQINGAVNSLKVADTEIRPNRLKTYIPQDHSGEVFIALPYNEGYNITLNGEKIDYERCLTGFISVDVMQGGELEISFITPKFILGLIVSLLGITTFILLCIFRNRLENNIPTWLTKTAAVLFVAVFLIFAAMVYIAPIILNLIS